MPRWYWISATFTLLWVAALQLSMGTLIEAGPLPVQGTVQELGYSFTGLWCLAAAWAWTRTKGPELDDPAKLKRHALRLMAAHVVLGLSGPTYYALAGLSAARHARSFACLPIVLFLLIPRRWPRS